MKIADLVVATGTYTSQNGEVKNRYENIGALMKNDQGKKYILLKKTFNPAGVPNNSDRGSILISIFDIQTTASQLSTPIVNAYAQQKQQFDDDMPF